MSPRQAQSAKGALLLMVLVCLVAGSGSQAAASGKPDATFNPALNTFGSNVFAIAVQADGKIIIGGAFLSVNAVSRNNIARLNTDGTLDTTFNPNTDSTVSAVVVQPDQKIIIGGHFTTVGGTARKYIARLNTNGSLDTSFNPGTGPDGDVLSIALQPDQTILVGGSFFTFNGASRGGVARLNTNGSLDTSFEPINGASNFVYAVASQADYQIIIGGIFDIVNGASRNRIARLNWDGSLDGSFDPGTGANNTVWAVPLQVDQKVLIGGDFTTVNGVARSRIARLNTNGSLDTSFNPGAGANATVYAVAVQADQKVIIGGNFTTVDGVARIRIARLNTDGSLDTSFNPATGADASVRAATVQADGKVIIGGTFTNVNNTTHTRLARLIGVGVTPADLDGDGMTDIAVWNPQSHNWYVIQSNTNTTRVVFDWGAGSLGDIAAPGDYDSDGKTDIAVFRPSEGNWYILQSTTNTATIINWGQSGDIAVAGDYDGDGKTDAAVFRPTQGNWYVRKSSGGTLVQGWGGSNDLAVPGDYDGDGKTDFAVWRPSEGNWYIRNSTGGVTLQGWGNNQDKPVPADYDGDGRVDVAVFRAGVWYIRPWTGSVVVRSWGDATDKPVPADFDGDGRADIAVWRPSDLNWYILQSATNTGRVANIPQSGVPVASAYLPQ